MSNVEIITEDVSAEFQQISPLQPHFIKPKQTHKIIKLTQKSDSQNSLSDEIQTPEAKNQKPKVLLHKMSKSTKDHKSDENFEKDSAGFSERLSLKSEMTDMNLEYDSCFSYSEFSKDELDEIEEFEIKTDKNIVNVQKNWKAFKIRRNYLFLLRKYKLCELLMEAIEKSKNQIENSKNELENSKNEFENSKNDFENSKNQIKHSKNELENSKNEPENDKNELKNDKSLIENSKNQIGKSKIQLESTREKLIGNCKKMKIFQEKILECIREGKKLENKNKGKSKKGMSGTTSLGVSLTEI